MSWVFDIIELFFGDEVKQKIHQWLKRRFQVLSFVQRKEINKYLHQIIYDFENYEHWKSERPIISIMERDDLYHHYIDLRAFDDLNNIYLIAKSFFQKWLLENNQNNLLILGDFGSGKSSLCLKMTYELAKDFINRPKLNFIPIYIPLNEMSFNLNSNGLLDSYVKTKYKLNLNHTKVKYILFFDGFDEISVAGDIYQVIKNLNNLFKEISENDKIVLTSRTSYPTCYFYHPSDIFYLPL